jgi:hypothetical protein
MISVRAIVMLTATTVISAALLSGCAPLACPAIGWSSRVDVAVDGSTERMSWLEVCADDQCVSAAGPSSMSEPPQPSPLMSDSGQLHLTEGSGTAWTLDVGMSAPERLTLRAFDAAGATIAESSVDLAWTRVGGSAACGGPSEAAPLTLTIE